MNDEYTFTINEEMLLQRFGDALNMNGGDFISYKRADYCSNQIFEVVSLLEMMAQHYPDRAKAVAETMIDKILHTETDDDWFPIPELKALYQIAGEEKDEGEVGDIYYDFCR